MILSSFKVSVQHLMLLQKLEKQPLSGKDVYSKLDLHLVDLQRLPQHGDNYTYYASSSYYW
jgi:hypothetical protein